jgi:hypothetical protein
MITRISVTFAMVLIAQTVDAYEWLSHNRMAYHSRRELVNNANVDEGLKAFIRDLAGQGYGEEIDTRAGNPCDVKQDANCSATDEDCTEGSLSALLWCSYHERPFTGGLLASREPRQGNV